MFIVNLFFILNMCRVHAAGAGTCATLQHDPATEASRGFRLVPRNDA